jgi:1-acyl-sn-glycerol-3-phosphate acyltransferase
MEYAVSGKSYFGEFEVHGKENVDGDTQYSIACHPHGTVIFQRTFWRSTIMDALFKKPWRMIGASALFYIPIVREMTLWFGAMDASKKNCEKILKGGASLVLYPGGLDEANIVTDGGNSSSNPDVNVRTRTGFIRLAVKYGTPVLPVFTFGELEAVDAVNFFPASITNWLKKKLRMSTTVFVGRFFTFMPFRVPFHLCFGKPIAVKQFAEDCKEADAEVARIHIAYKAELLNIYDTHKQKRGYGNRKLVFTCEEAAVARDAKIKAKSDSGESSKGKCRSKSRSKKVA